MSIAFRRNAIRVRVPSHASLPNWLGDLWDARRCARAGIPQVGDDGPPTPTGRQSEIGRTADDAIARVRQSCQRLTRDDEATLATLLERIRQIDEHLGVLRAEETAILEQPAERLASETGLDDAVVAARRAADNRTQAAPVRAYIDELVAERGELAIEAARIDHTIVMQWRAARSTARAIAEIARRREARYWRLLCHRHPEGPRLADLFDHPRIALAAWVEGPADERSQ